MAGYLETALVAGAVLTVLSWIARRRFRGTRTRPSDPGMDDLD